MSHINVDKILQEFMSLQTESNQFSFESSLDLVKLGASVDSKCNLTGKTLLIEAVSRHEVDVMNELIELGADVNIQDDDGLSCLMKASLSGFSDTVIKLLDLGANPNLKSNVLGHTALMLVTQGKKYDLMSALLDAGADINTQGYDGRAAIYRCVGQNDIKGVELLLERGADTEARDNTGQTVLEYAESIKSVMSVNIIETIKAHIDKNETLSSSERESVVNDSFGLKR